MAIDTGTTSIHVTKDDKDTFEKFELDKIGVGEAYHTAVEEMEILRNYRVERKQELRQEIQEIREEAKSLGIEWSEIV